MRDKSASEWRAPRTQQPCPRAFERSWQAFCAMRGQGPSGTSSPQLASGCGSSSSQRSVRVRALPISDELVRLEEAYATSSEVMDRAAHLLRVARSRRAAAPMASVVVPTYHGFDSK